MKKKNIVVIGGGPAGYTAAIRASQLGAGVTLIEQQELGGACLNKACIPTKFLLRSVEIYQLIKHSARYGISVAGTDINMAELQSRKKKLVSTLRTGLAGVIEMNGIEVIKGCARLTPEKRIEITDERDEKHTIGAEKIILAAGSKAVIPNIPGADSTGIILAEDILNLDCVPESIVIIGGGMVGVEMATILVNMGCRVHLIEMMPRVLPDEDAEITTVLEGALKRDGVSIYTGAVVTRIDADGEKKQVFMSTQTVEKSIEAESVAIAVGYEPYIDGLGLKEYDIATCKGCIKVDEHLQTSVADIYAAGDITGGIMLAYVAMAEGCVAAENALGVSSKINYEAVPRCVFSLPEVASVGLTEERAKTQGYQVKCGRFPFAVNSAASILGERRGFVKIVADKESKKVLGVHIIGAGAVNLIMEATLAIKLGATLDDIKNTLHAHPTLSEALWEAVLDFRDETIHLKR